MISTGDGISTRHNLSENSPVEVVGLSYPAIDRPHKRQKNQMPLSVPYNARALVVEVRHP
jgi:hypothetical protein